MKDFTLEKYRQLLSAIKALQIPVYGVADWLRLQPRWGILLRHDVDRWTRHALFIAQAEKEIGIRATYYFRFLFNDFPQTVIRQIASLGHEIGYHYEDLAAAGGDYSQAVHLFQAHLNQLRAITPVATVAMHGSPLSKYDNRDLFKKFHCREFDLVGEAYLDIDYRDCYYLTDTGRTWKTTPLNFRDRPHACLTAPVASTDELIDFLQANKDRRIAILTHPERWSRSQSEYWFSWMFDQSINLGKRLILLTPNRSHERDTT